ncbi:MAG: alpha/beta fold hydrolase [Leptospirales bacterium]|nr:alpha/beta fold hydrolase [Leptospirales bacterium]
MKSGRAFPAAVLYLLALLASQIVQGFPESLPADRRLVALNAAGQRRSWMAYREEGRQGAPAILLLHGSPGTASDLSRISAALAGRFHVISPDLLCAGYSDAYAPDCGAAAQSQAVLRLMDHLHLNSAWIFAHSFSGAVAIELASLAPRRVQGVIAYGALGVQEAEGSGDYSFEHFKYNLGYAFLAVGLELLPHFGLLGSASMRHGFLKQFMDLDQRSLRQKLSNLPVPALFVHGDRDPLVPAWAAEEHHRLVAHSDLVILKESHFMVFSASGSQRLARLIEDFIERTNRGASSGNAVRESLSHLQQPQLPVDLRLDPTLSAWGRLLAIISATFVSEDLTCISAGLLVQAGKLDAISAVFACFIGIFLGDLGLYGLGRLAGAGLQSLGFLRNRLPQKKLEELRRRFDREGWKLVLFSRFVPGLRFPTYVGAGLLGGRAGVLAGAALLAGLIWTPLLVLSTARFGAGLAAWFQGLTGSAWTGVALAIISIYLLLRLLMGLLSREGRSRLLARLGRMRRPEFWPPWIFYAPLVPWCAWLSIRYGGFKTVTASNPGMENSGFIGESKARILDQLPLRWRLQHVLASPAPLEERMSAALQAMRAAGLSFPLASKPNVGEKGVGLRIVHDRAQLQLALQENPLPLVLQRYHAGPGEAGVFYYRYPDQQRGEILAITEKVFPILRGDGKRNLQRLILDHPRYRMQWRVYLKRFADRLEETPADGEEIVLTRTGNHFQGCIFRDGAALINESLCRRFDEIADQIDGFYFGRFDVRYSDREAFRRGEDLALLELNGATAEATVIYDPDYTIGQIYRMLFRQWRILFEIGAANRKRGAQPMGNLQILGALLQRLREDRPPPIGA